VSGCAIWPGWAAPGRHGPAEPGKTNVVPDDVPLKETRYKGVTMYRVESPRSAANCGRARYKDVTMDHVLDDVGLVAIFSA
jgi:hypothetical protein